MDAATAWLQGCLVWLAESKVTPLLPRWTEPVPRPTEEGSVHTWSLLVLSTGSTSASVTRC